MPRSLEMAQHDAVIAAEFDDERIAASSEDVRHHRLGECLEMRLHVARGAGIEGVVTVEHLVGPRLLDDLKHAAWHCRMPVRARKNIRSAISSSVRKPLAIGIRPNDMNRKSALADAADGQYGFLGVGHRNISRN